MSDLSNCFSDLGENSNDLRDGQFWLVRDNEIVVARETASFPDAVEPYVLLDLFLDPQETIIVERSAKFILEVV